MRYIGYIGESALVALMWVAVIEFCLATVFLFHMGVVDMWSAVLSSPDPRFDDALFLTVSAYGSLIVQTVYKTWRFALMAFFVLTSYFMLRNMILALWK